MTNWQQTTVYVLIAGVMFVVDGCKPELTKRSWEPMDYAQFLEDLENPTGPLVNDSYEETSALVAAELGVELGVSNQITDDLEVLYQLLETTLGVLEESRGGSPEPVDANGEEPLTGTNIFALVSCLGDQPTEQPVTDFSAGTIRFESNTFSLLDDGRAELDGHILAEWIDCQHGLVAIDGSCPGYMDDFQDHIAFALDLTYTIEGFDSRRRDDNVLFADNSIQMVVDVEGNGKYVLGFTPGVESEFVLGTAEGFSVCNVGIAGGLSCEVTPN